jgi:hypothetical protein
MLDIEQYYDEVNSGKIIEIGFYKIVLILDININE